MTLRNRATLLQEFVPSVPGRRSDTSWLFRPIRVQAEGQLSTDRRLRAAIASHWNAEAREAKHFCVEALDIDFEHEQRA
jgi:hypothetical protein